MIQVTREEAMYIREHFPKVYVARTRHKYYVPEVMDVMRALPYNEEAKQIVSRARKGVRSGKKK